MFTKSEIKMSKGYIDGRTFWEETEISFLKDNYLILGTKEISYIINRTKDTIQNKLRELGLHRGNEVRRSIMSRLMSGKNNPMYKRKHSVETLNIMKEKKRILSESGKLSSWNKGLTKETDERVKKYGAKVSIAKRGRKPSPESKEKLIIGLKKRWSSEEGEIMKERASQRWIKNNPMNDPLLREKARINKIKKLASGEIIPLRGDKHGRWAGGVAYEPYTPEFNKAFKLAIKQREGFMCIKCGMREEDSKILFKSGLHTHHIDYMKENTFKENCCALCNRCNAEANANRNHWTKFFQSLLSERYGYQYSEDGKIMLNWETAEENCRK